MKGGGGGAVFLAMQVLKIPAGGRGFPLVYDNGAINSRSYSITRLHFLII